MSYIRGLTGGISTGKSHLSDTLRGKGVPVVDEDRISHAVTAPGGAALPGFGAAYIALADAPVKTLEGGLGLMRLNGQERVIDDLWANGTAPAAYWLWENR